LSKEAQRFPKVNALFFHYEREDIATGIAGTETMPALALRIDEE
jgi:hypothetical protein